MKSFAVLSAFVVLLSGSRFASASDHIDGPVTIANQVADIVDLYAFPTPGSLSSLTLILDVYPFVSSSGHFSDKVNYNFILRKAAPAPDRAGLVTDAASEVVITCKFITPQQVADTQMICTSGEAQPRVVGQIAFNEMKQPTVGNNILLFGGRRADPFFLSKDFAGSFMKFQKGTPDGKNVMNNLNCLSIVMNVDVNLLFPPSAQGKAAELPKNKVASTKETVPARKVAQVESYLIAVAAESVTFDKPGAPPRRIDRIGRPEVTNIGMNMNVSATLPEIRDTYNADRPFNVPADKMSGYVARLRKNMEGYDKIDGQQDWDAKDLTRLAAITGDDYLVIDPFIPCQQSSYFEIETALMLGKPHLSCGGRDPNDNVVNKQYTLYEKGLAAMSSVSVSDGLKGPTKPISPSFPYLAEPYDGPAAWLSQKIANAAKNLL